MNTLAQRNERIVTSLRSRLRELARKRTDRVVTADDAQFYMNEKRWLRNDTSARIAVINSAFQGGNFAPVGYTNSVRPEARSRMITEWSPV